jgi:AcrR family transcriptional regulator
MARPKDADPKETRERVLRCACDLLSEADGTFSLRAVARKAEVSIGTLQYHFVDKQSLVDACIDTVYLTFNELAPTFVSQLGTSTDTGEFVGNAVRFGFTYARQNQPFIRILEASIVQNGGLDMARNKATQQPFLENISSLLGNLLPVGEQEIRLRLNSIILLIGRYSIMEESALLDIFTPEEGKSVIGTAEDHLVSLAKILLAPPSASS